MKVGIRIDVDTLRGTRLGVPNLLRDLDERGALATFFFSVGPDNMGRHLLRLLRPTFARKMLRTRAARLYGWDVLLRGTLGPGPIISEKCADVFRACADAGHEVGLHAWDHHRWQVRVDRMDDEAIHADMERGLQCLENITGHRPTCFAAPGWRAHAGVFRCEARLGLRFASDCRGAEPFRPIYDGVPVGPTQIPATLPTYDEVVGGNGQDADGFVRQIVSALKPVGLNVLTLHAEVEGLAARRELSVLLDGIGQRGGCAVPLGSLVPPVSDVPHCEVVQAELIGREGAVARQSPRLTPESPT